MKHEDDAAMRSAEERALSSESPYLYDPRAEPDAELRELETLLRPLAWKGSAADALRVAGGDALRDASAGRSRTRRAEPRQVMAYAAAAVILLALGLFSMLAGTDDGAYFRVIESGRRLPRNADFVASAEERHLALGDDRLFLDLDPGSRLRVAKLGKDEAALSLERGRLVALVAADVRPRFFQVQTPSARCIDLGCAYTLEVADDGTAHVPVQLGEVAFEHQGREVFVPMGARCVARRGVGAGTPRFDDVSEDLEAALDRFDGAQGAEARAKALPSVLAATTRKQDSLSLWHILMDPSPKLRERTRAKLLDLLGVAEGPQASELAAWKALLRESW